MNGMKYFRLKGHFSKEQVVQVTGVSQVVLDQMEMEQEHTRNCLFYMALAKFYGVFVEDLLAEYPEETLTPGDQYVRKSTVDPRNCVEAWRREHYLNYLQVAQTLGLKTRESGRVVCKNPNPRLAHLRTLAQLENMSVEGFLQKYDGWAKDDHPSAEAPQKAC